MSEIINKEIGDAIFDFVERSGEWPTKIVSHPWLSHLFTFQSGVNRVYGMEVIFETSIPDSSILISDDRGMSKLYGINDVRSMSNDETEKLMDRIAIKLEGMEDPYGNND